MSYVLTKNSQSILVCETDILDCIDALNKWDYDNMIDTVKYYTETLTINKQISDKNVREKSELIIKQFKLLPYDKHGKEFLRPAVSRIILLILCHFKRSYMCNDTLFPAYLPKFRPFSNIMNIHQEISYAYCYLLAALDIELDSTYKIINDIRFHYIMSPAVKNSLFTVYETMLDHEENLTLKEFFKRLEECYYLEAHLRTFVSIIKDFNEFIERYEYFLNKYLDFLNNDSSETFNFEKLSIPMPCTDYLDKDKVRGLCVIINIVNIVSEPIRHGSKKDVQLLTNLFKEMNFIVRICKEDCNKEELDREINDIKSNSDYCQYACLVVFIMSHGILNFFYTSDRQQISVRDTIRNFDDSTIWKEKPRLIFIQACRNIKPESTTHELTENDLSSNMLLAFSCHEDKTSKRHPEVGGLYIQILCLLIYLYGDRFVYVK
ncbi:unnamed protein product [Didymodactylos carnosus]|uniref:Caspase-8 n=1 Tax=Didymodactylos carnosus TaxID=1234261 RepID=A0A8S2EYV5_9BILA|nr:unnamed protein product [Didymodactylos carnosus]CAF4115103.1 unnamed protein product [Didymodactylos carnosus]